MKIHNKIANWKWRVFCKEIKIIEKVAPFLCNKFYQELDELEGETWEMKREADFLEEWARKCEDEDNKTE